VELSKYKSHRLGEAVFIISNFYDGANKNGQGSFFNNKSNTHNIVSTDSSSLKKQLNMESDLQLRTKYNALKAENHKLKELLR